MTKSTRPNPARPRRRPRSRAPSPRRGLPGRSASARRSLEPRPAARTRSVGTILLKKRPKPLGSSPQVKPRWRPARQPGPGPAHGGAWPERAPPPPSPASPCWRPAAQSRGPRPPARPRVPGRRLLHRVPDRGGPGDGDLAKLDVVQRRPDRQPGHGRGRVARPGEAHPGGRRRSRGRRGRRDPRDRHDGGDRVLPEPGHPEPEAGGPGRRDAPGDRDQRGRPDEPLQRRRDGRPSRRRRGRGVLGGRQRRDPLRPRGREDEHDPGRHLQELALWARGLGQLRPPPLLRQAGPPPHRAKRLPGPGPAAATGRHHLRPRGHDP
jgi:hypothetical protein